MIETLTVSSNAAKAAAPQIPTPRRRMKAIPTKTVSANARPNPRLPVQYIASAEPQTATDAMLAASESVSFDVEKLRDDCHRSKARIAAVTASSTPSAPTSLTALTSGDLFRRRSNCDKIPSCDRRSAKQTTVVAIIKANSTPSALDRSSVTAVVTHTINVLAQYWMSPRSPAPVSIPILPATAYPNVCWVLSQTGLAIPTYPKGRS